MPLTGLWEREATRLASASSHDPCYRWTIAVSLQCISGIGSSCWSRGFLSLQLDEDGGKSGPCVVTACAAMRLPRKGKDLDPQYLGGLV